VLERRTRELDPRTVGIGKRVLDLAFGTLDGRAGRLSDFAGQRALVIAARGRGCRVAQRYGPRLAELEREYAALGVAFLFVDLDPDLDLERARVEDVEAHGLRGTYVHDPAGAFGRALGIEATGAVFLLDASRTLRYRGALDDQYGRGAVQPEPRRAFLRDALESVLAGEPVLLAATEAPGRALGFTRKSAPAAEPTYHQEVARILQQNCAACHHAGGGAPFSLEDYETVYDKRRMIGLVVEERIMPPWYAADGGPWKNDARLSDEDVTTLTTWVAAGAPEGDPADAPTAVEWPAGWLIGEPDEIFQLKRERVVPAEGVVDYLHLRADRKVPRDMWVERMQVLPGAPSVVHHAAVTFQAPPDYGKEPPDTLLEALVPWRKKVPRREFLWGYTPGRGPRIFPPGVACFVPAGSRIFFNMHYTPSGVETTDRTQFGLVLAKEKPFFSSQTSVVRNYDVVVEPGGTAMFEAELELPHEVILRSLQPHMHLRGRSFIADLIYPDGREERLIHVPEWDMDWQLNYVYRDEPVLPAGTRVHITGWFDNTSANPNNPDPEIRVVEGLRRARRGAPSGRARGERGAALSGAQAPVMTFRYRAKATSEISALAPAASPSSDQRISGRRSTQARMASGMQSTNQPTSGAMVLPPRSRILGVQLFLVTTKNRKIPWPALMVSVPKSRIQERSRGGSSRALRGSFKRSSRARVAGRIPTYPVKNTHKDPRPGVTLVRRIES
jgi:mono/diheme cytochrome c family protein